MRNLLLSLLFLFLAFANATPSIFAAFLEPLSSLEETISEGNDTAPANELLKRQTGCASGYGSCSNLGAPGLCCKSNSVCSADSAGHVACCPINAACTGTIAGVIGASVTATSTVSFVFASTTTNPATTTGNFYFGTSTASVASVQGASAATYTRSTPLALQLIRAARLTSQAALRRLVEAYTVLQSLVPTAALQLQQLQLPWIQPPQARFARA